MIEVTLKELREKAGLTQTQLANAMGVGQQWVSDIERAPVGTMRLSTVLRYVTACGCGLRVVAVVPWGQEVVLL